jgi:hypothetical protein
MKEANIVPLIVCGLLNLYMIFSPLATVASGDRRTTPSAGEEADDAVFMDREVDEEVEPITLEV